MEYKQRREKITINEMIYDGCQEQPVDLELTLPDYCPDIQKILKCQLCPAVVSASIVGDSADINGSVMVRVLYLDPKGEKLRCYETTTQFSSNIPVKTVTGNGVVIPRTNVEYVNCRAISSRRLDIHGAFSVCACVWEQRELALLHSVEEDDVEQLKTEGELCVSAGLSQQFFMVEEVLALGDSKPCAEMILRTDAHVVQEEVRQAGGKIQVTGHIALKVLYLTDLSDGMPETMEFTLPFRQQLDCGREGKSDLSVQLMGVNVQIKSDSNGENNLLQAEVKLSASVQCYVDNTVTFVTDAYSRTMEVTLEQEQRTFYQYEGTYSDVCTQKNGFEFPDGGITKIMDVWNESCSVSAVIEETGLLYKGKFNLCMLALNQEGNPFYFERMMEFQYNRDNSSHTIQFCRPKATVTNLSYRITGNTAIEVKAELQLEASIFSEQQYRFVETVIPNPDLIKAKDKEASLVLYYAEGGETLWDIAKQYATGVREIQEENALTEPVLDQPMMLLIPVSS